jgi:hypothetical protein
MSFENGQPASAAGELRAAQESSPYLLELAAIIRPHWSKLFLPSIALAICAALVVFSQNRLDQHSFNTYLLPAAGVVALLFWFVPSLRLLTNRLEIDTQTIVYKHGRFGLKTQSVSFAALSSVAIRRRFLAALFRSGDLVLTANNGSEIVVRSVPRIKAVVKALQGMQTGQGMKTGAGMQTGAGQQTPARIGL